MATKFHANLRGEVRVNFLALLPGMFVSILHSKSFLVPEINPVIRMWQVLSSAFCSVRGIPRHLRAVPSQVPATPCFEVQNGRPRKHPRDHP